MQLSTKVTATGLRQQVPGNALILQCCLSCMQQVASCLVGAADAYVDDLGLCICCRSRASIITAYMASTLLVMLWLTYIIHVTLRENEEDARSIHQGPRVSEFLKACASSFVLQLFLACHVMSYHIMYGACKAILLILCSRCMDVTGQQMKISLYSCMTITYQMITSYP